MKSDLNAASRGVAKMSGDDNEAEDESKRGQTEYQALRC